MTLHTLLLTMKKKYILWFEEVGKEDVGVVGGKGANLGEMINAKLPVPYGFVVSADAYFYFIEKNNLTHKIEHALHALNVENTKELVDAAKRVQKLILSQPVPKDLHLAIVDHYNMLLSRQADRYKSKSVQTAVAGSLSALYKDPLVAVRSSATAEDLPDASFAGQQETYLNIAGENNVIQKVRECWASLFTERAIYYRQQKGFDHLKVGLAAVVQLMVQSDVSGVAFSVDPISHDKKTITIEAIYGLGEYIVQGRVTPDHYEVDKQTLAINKSEIKKQTIELSKKGTETVERAVTGSRATSQKLTPKQIIEVAKLVKRIEKHYFFPQDIEWALEDGVVYITQSRPITTVSQTGSSDNSAFVSADGAKLLFKADPASPGVAIGRPVVLTSPKENDKIKKGDILVSSYTSPDYVPAMKRAVAIVTEMGGRTSHAAIVSRELGIPAVVGAENATKLLARERIISVNGSTGEVYKGSVVVRAGSTDSQSADAQKKIKTTTKVYVNLAQPEAAERVAKLHVDGIGLLRAEFIMADIGVHPKLIIKQGKQNEFIDTLTEKLLLFAKPFSPRPITYRANDFRTNEYRHLKGGETYEPSEENPMIGFRGASRYIADRQVFAMELEAIKRVRAAGYKNINLMIPFIRVPSELVEIKKIIAEHGLLGRPSFKLWIMVEVPSSVILIDEFLKIGVDGVSVGTNDLTMLLLGVDRDNHEIAHLYDERNPAVLWALKRVITACKKHNATVSICGQGPSDYPELAEQLVRWGMTSLSVTPDVIGRTRMLVADIEKKLWQESKK